MQGLLVGFMLFASQTVLPLMIKVLSGLGIGVAVYTGINSLIDLVESQVVGYLLGLPPLAVAILGRLEIDVALSVLISALAMAATIKGVTSSGVFKSWGFS